MHEDIYKPFMNFSPLDLQGKTAKDEFPFSKEKFF